MILPLLMFGFMEISHTFFYSLIVRNLRGRQGTYNQACFTEASNIFFIKGMRMMLFGILYL